MTPWLWWAGDVGDKEYALACAEPTRETVIAEAMRWLEVGDEFEIIEARQSTDKIYEGADFAPFLRTRNREILKVGPRA